MNDFFKGLKVLDLSTALAGPAASMFLAELGAKVVKVENKRTNGDMTRKWKLPVEPKDRVFSAYYCSVNWNKEILLLDLQVPEELRQVLDFAKEADVVISNFKSASAKKLGIDYLSLRALNPGLIFAQITGFGPGIKRPAFDVVLQAEAGFLYMCGEPDGMPVKMPVAMVDVLASHQLKEGILLALLHRERTGEGGFIEASLFEAAVAALVNQATNWLMAGHIPQRMGTMHPNIAPYGFVFETKDEKYLILASGTEAQVDQVFMLLGIAELKKDPRFVTNEQRIAHRKELKAKMDPAFLQYTREELMTLFEKAGIPAGRILDMQEVFERPVAQQMILEEIMPDGTPSKRVRTAAFHWTPASDL
jgi:crotonobetainyl-CoA:carnitine CoA-transferase CaiB-like acyl-CoA transferase